MERSRLVFSGSGGQGVITAAIILAKAAAIFENKNAIQSQSYGAAARGVPPGVISLLMILKFISQKSSSPMFWSA